ncbi:MAG: peptidoglycan DD-metalloendopeptidase family protein [Candidatus Melainabacteria bacterium]|nr:peptidoglycan DD-metalloendopeptidase family protein [Candidatus Melainabacteria bacterium]
MHSKKRSNIFTKIIILAVLASFLLTSILPLFALIDLTGKQSLTVSEKKRILEDINEQKSTLSEKIKQARLKELEASKTLRQIDHKLTDARKQVAVQSRYLSSNQEAWKKTKARLDELNDKKAIVEEKAKERVVAIYKKSQLRFIDSLIRSQSPTDYMDYLYFQRKVIDFDKKLLDTLKSQSEDIAKYGSSLEEETKRIEQITSKLKNIEEDIVYQQKKQKEILSKLRQETAMYESSERQLERESIKLVYKISELSTGKNDNPESTGSFSYPVRAPITSPFGPRRHPIFGVRSMHSGIDLAAPYGTPIKASEGGVVIYSGWYGGYGKVVILDHAKGFSTLYAHLSSTKVTVGARVKQGEVVGFEGSTGYATGPHLHFEVREQGKPKNPVIYLGGN